MNNKITIDSNLEDLNLTPKSLEILKCNGYNTIRNICDTNEEELKRIGKRIYYTIRYKLHSYGFLLKGEKEKFIEIRKQLDDYKEVNIDKLDLGLRGNYKAKSIICNGKEIKRQLNEGKLLKSPSKANSIILNHNKHTFNKDDITSLNQKILLIISKNNHEGNLYNEIIFIIRKLGFEFETKQTKKDTELTKEQLNFKELSNLKNIKIDKLNLPNLTYYLEKRGINNFATLVSLSTDNLDTIRYIGPKHKQEIIDKVHSLGLKFANENDLTKSKELYNKEQELIRRIQELKLEEQELIKQREILDKNISQLLQQLNNINSHKLTK